MTTHSNNWKTFMTFALRVIVAHTATYFLFGLLMSNVFHYGTVFEQAIIRDYYLPFSEHPIIIGPFLQPLRGLIFAIGLWPIRGFLVEKKHGWLILWSLFFTIGILSTPSAAPSSLEGMVYTKIPMWFHLMGLPEITLQTLLFSIWLVWWERQAEKSHVTQAQKDNPLVAEGIKAVMAACFAYIGYAAGGLLIVTIMNAMTSAAGSARVDVEAAGSNIKMQLMFVVAFFANTLAIFWVTSKWQAIHIPLWGLFLLFWGLDALVPWLYQTAVFGGSYVPTALMLGFFPALIIIMSLWLNNRKRVRLEGKLV